MIVGKGNGGRAPKPYILRAIRHGIAAGACRKAARVDPAQAERWNALANDQSALVREKLTRRADHPARP